MKNTNQNAARENHKHQYVWLLLLGLCSLLILPLATQAKVKIDQKPLATAANLPPNIVLMLDDSGSMARDYMPDNVDDEVLNNAGYNGIYYDPTVRYTPPFKKDGIQYPTYTDITDVTSNAFNSGDNEDLTDYSENFSFSDSNWGKTTKTYSNSSHRRSYDEDDCEDEYDDRDGFGGYDFESYGWRDGGKCTFKYHDYKRYHFFKYKTGAKHNQTTHYVAASGTDCPYAPDPNHCVSADGTPTGDDAVNNGAPEGVRVGTNIANWFAYYHTRMLTAKTGLMKAFNNLDKNYRFGFGSIDGNNATDSALGQDYYSFSTSAAATYTNDGSFAYWVDYDSGLSKVKPFGDGSSGTQKARFWNWLVDEDPNGGTALRQSLQAVGEYYKTDQPWYTSRSDHTQLACRQSYTILTTDGFWNGKPPTNINNADANDGPEINEPAGRHYQYTTKAPYKENHSYHDHYGSDSLADVALYYWYQDLKSDIGNEVPTSNADQAFWQHMTTFTLGMGFEPQGIEPAGTDVSDIFDWANGGDPIDNFSWPIPTGNSINNIADMVHAAVNGHGMYYQASSPKAFAAGIANALKRVKERTGSSSGLAANSAQLNTGTRLYQALYHTGQWTGNLRSFSLNPNNGEINTPREWAADEAMPEWSERTVETYSPKSGFFQFDMDNLGKLSTDQQQALGSTDKKRKKMLKYLLGDDANETRNGGNFRSRESILGDIVNSGPIYVGKPSPNLYSRGTFKGASDYNHFAEQHLDRQGTLWVAANDGMLHQFSAVSGAEMYAYLPGAVITANIQGAAKIGISNLSDPGYGTSANPHEYFNDGKLAVADVHINGKWKTILVGTTGRGPARVVYALDVTDPNNPKVKWERSANDGKSYSNYIGQMTGKPIIAMTSKGKWVAYIGNGYNSAKGTAALLEFNLTDGHLSVYKTNHKGDNGLSTPAIWIPDPTNNKAKTAYAGDLYGNVWKFDLTKGRHRGTSIFTAKDASDNVQPITGGMLAGRDRDTGARWLFFGTGQALSQDDLTTNGAYPVQTWYGLIVEDGNLSGLPDLSKGRSALKERSITTETTGNPNAEPPKMAGRLISQGENGDMDRKAGWYIDLVSPTHGRQGERMTLTNQFADGYLIGISHIPNSNSDPCDPSGSSWIMSINPFTGTNPDEVYSDMNGDGVFDESDKISGSPAAGIKIGSRITRVTSAGSNNNYYNEGPGGGDGDGGGNNKPQNWKTNGGSGNSSRVSWRELITQ